MPQIEAISFDLIRQAVEAANNNRPAGPTMAVIAALSKKFPAEQMLAVTYRLQALANVMAERQTDNWTLKIADKEYTLVDEALFKAAARAPLSTESDEIVGEISFGAEELLAIALEESEPDGLRN
jgi:hypothetical protein